MEVSAQHQAEALADPWNRPQQGERVAVLLRSRVADAQLDGAEPRVVVVNERESHGAALLAGRLGNPRRHPLPVRFGGELRAELGQVSLALGLLDLGQPLRPLVHQRPPAPEQSPRGSPRGGIARRLGPHTPTEPHRNLLRSDLTVFGFAPVTRLHVERVAQADGKTFAGAAVGAPGPR
jgi:hypothetical protein